MSVAVINVDSKLKEVLNQITSEDLNFIYFSELKDLDNPERFHCIISNEVSLPESFKNLAIVIGKDKNSNIVKPFKIRSLLNLLTEYLNNRVYNIGPLNFHPFSKQLWAEKNDNKINLTEKESSLLFALVKSQEGTLTKDYVLKKLWHYSDESETNTLETHIYNLKNKLSSINSINLIEIKDKTIFLNKNFN